MANYFDQLNYPKAPKDRHFIAEHFGILFTFFGLMVKKLSNFKVHLNFLFIVLISESRAEMFFYWASG